MKHENIIELLGAWLDGELPEDQAAAVEAELAECVACQEELEGLVAMRDAFREPVLAAAQAASFDGVWERIEAQIGPSLSPVPVPEVLPEAVRKAVTEERPGLWTRLAAAWDNVFGAQPLLPAAFAAALVVAVAIALLLPDGSKDVVPSRGGEPASISAADPGKAGAPAVPIAGSVEENNRAWISSVQYTQGTVIIDQVSDDPTEPTIVWHYEDEPVVEETQGG